MGYSLGRSAREVFLPRWVACMPRLIASLFARERIDAITILRTTFFLIPDPSDRLRCHEFCHRVQCHREGRLRFLWGYIGEYIRNGYRNNRYEVEARLFSGEDS